MSLWYSSTPSAHCSGLENTYQCKALILLPAFWVPGQGGCQCCSHQVVYLCLPRNSETSFLHSSRLPRTQYVFNILDQVLPLACWVLTVRVVCPVLLEKSRPVTVDTVRQGEENKKREIFLLLKLYSGITDTQFLC